MLYVKHFKSVSRTACDAVGVSGHRLPSSVSVSPSLNACKSAYLISLKLSPAWECWSPRALFLTQSWWAGGERVDPSV